MSYKKEVERAIYEALRDYDYNVEYTPASRNGDRCAYFTVTINGEDWVWDWIENDIEKICEEYGLWIDDDSKGDFDLCIC